MEGPFARMTYDGRPIKDVRRAPAARPGPKPPGIAGSDRGVRVGRGGATEAGHSTLRYREATRVPTVTIATAKIATYPR